MKISIITPSFNQGNYLEKTIQSILNQNYPHLEYMVIDGGSTDNSIGIIKKYEKDLTYWVSEKDNGQSEAINKGLKKAQGEVVAWLNSDDLYLPETFKIVAKKFSDNPDVDIIYGDVINFYDSKKEEHYNIKRFDPIDFISRNPIHQPSVFWRRKVHSDIGFLDTSLHYCMDYDLWMRLFLRHKALKINATLSKFRVHPKAKTSNNPKQLYYEYRKIVSRFFNSLNDESFVTQLKNLGIYINEENKKYEIRTNDLPLKKMLNAYIYQCAIQEYSWKNKKMSNKLFLQNFFFHPLNRFFFLLKNNLFNG